MTTLITIVGEQPIPLLLPARALRPDAVVHLCTKRTRPVAERVAGLDDLAPDYVEVADAYDLPGIRNSLVERLAGVDTPVFNLTGGTKMMVLAAYAIAAERGAPFVYYRTEGPRGREQQSVLYRYRFQDGQPVLEARQVLARTLITLDDYLRAHLPAYREEGFSPEAGGDFEQAVALALDQWVDAWMAGVRPEGIKDQVEIDLAIQCGNQVGILEVKLGGEGSGKRAVDQLTTAAAREYLGTYTARFLVTAGERSNQYIALARELDIHVITLPDYRDGRLSARDTRRLRQVIAQYLPCSKAR